jgi:3-oxoacyl-[acyl-carrier protein] reductase
MFDLSGKKALVTGATGGIGGAIARALHAQGAVVTLSGTRRQALDELAGALGERVHVVEANLADKDSVEALVPAAETAMEGLDILVNNAGVTRDNLFLRMKDEEWDTVIAVNLTAAFRLSRAAVKGMMRRRSGRIVNIGSVVGATGNPGQGNYAASKAGLVGMTKALAAEVASRGITVNCVAPGFIESPMTDALNDKQREAILGTIPMARLGQGGEIAAAVVYLASGEAGYVTGHTLHVNGGMAMFERGLVTPPNSVGEPGHPSRQSRQPCVKQHASWSRGVDRRAKCGFARRKTAVRAHIRLEQLFRHFIS